MNKKADNPESVNHFIQPSFSTTKNAHLLAKLNLRNLNHSVMMRQSWTEAEKTKVPVRLPSKSAKK